MDLVEQALRQLHNSRLDDHVLQEAPFPSMHVAEFSIGG